MKNNRETRDSAAVVAGKTRWVIRVIWLFSALAWLGIWLFNAANGRTPWGLLAFVMLLHLGGCVLLGRVSMRLVQSREEAEDLVETLEASDAINRDLRARRHDVINHLQVVYSLLQLGDQKEALAYLEKINQDFVSARAVLRTRDSAVNALLQAKMIQGQHRGLRMEMDVATDLEELPMESWEFCRVLGNLLDNAMDAAEEAEPGEGFVSLHLWMEPGSLRFSVANNGAAVAEEDRERIFEAGFTTKGERGTGMGLYIVRSLLDAAGGRILVESDGSRTAFYGDVPVSGKDEERAV